MTPVPSRNRVLSCICLWLAGLALMSCDPATEKGGFSTTTGVLEERTFPSMDRCKEEAHRLGNQPDAIITRRVEEPWSIAVTTTNGDHLGYLCIPKGAETLFVKVSHTHGPASDTPFPVGTMMPEGFKVYHSEALKSLASCKDQARKDTGGKNDFIADRDKSLTIIKGGVTYTCIEHNGAGIYVKAAKNLP